MLYNGVPEKRGFCLPLYNSKPEKHGFCPLRYNGKTETRGFCLPLYNSRPEKRGFCPLRYNGETETRGFGSLLYSSKVNISILQKNTRDRGTSLPASAVAGWGFAIPSGSKTILLEKIAAFSAFP